MNPQVEQHIEIGRKDVSGVSCCRDSSGARMALSVDGYVYGIYTSHILFPYSYRGRYCKLDTPLFSSSSWTHQCCWLHEQKLREVLSVALSVIEVSLIITIRKTVSSIYFTISNPHHILEYIKSSRRNVSLPRSTTLQIPSTPTPHTHTRYLWCNVNARNISCFTTHALWKRETTAHHRAKRRRGWLYHWYFTWIWLLHWDNIWLPEYLQGCQGWVLRAQTVKDLCGSIVLVSTALGMGDLWARQ